MALNPALVKHGTSNGVDINVDLSRIEHGAVRYVTLSYSYMTLNPPGAPSRPAFTGASAANLDFSKTIANGTRLALLAGEAAALVAANVAAYS
jgi:hypothetical protein